MLLPRRMTLSHRILSSHRRGSVVKWIAIVLGAIVLIVAGSLYYVHHKVTSQAAKPLPIPDVTAKPEVETSLKRRVEQHIYVPSAAPGAAPAAASQPGKISITGEELSLLVVKLMPPIDGMKLEIQIVDGSADIKLSIPSAPLMKLAGDQLGQAGEYIRKNLAWLNVDAVAGVRFAEGQLAITVKTVREPSFLSPPQLQQILDGALKSRPPGPLVVPIADLPFQVTELELAGDVAITTVQRMPPGTGDGKR